MTTFNGGSPVSSRDNPFNSGAGTSEVNVLPSLMPEERERSVMMDLDAYGSNPVTDDAAAQRPSDPPTNAF